MPRVLPLEVDAHRRLPPARAHPGVLDRDPPGEREDQPPGELGRRRARHLRAAQDDAVRCRGVHVDRRVAHARRDQQAEIRQPVEELHPESGALAHRADDLKISKRIGGGLFVRKRLIEDGDVDPVGDFGPVRHRNRQVEIIVEDCTAQPRHRKVRSLARMTAERRRRGRSPSLRAIVGRASGLDGSIRIKYPAGSARSGHVLGPPRTARARACNASSGR